MQFGILGSLYAQHLMDIPNPKVGLMNIGEEEEKGNLLTMAAHKMLKELGTLNFVGNLEGRDLFNEKADVIITDGFTGNVLLKMAESFFVLIKRRRIEDAFFNLFNYEDYGGSPILGLNKPVLIGHGISNAKAIKNMLKHAAALCQSDISERIRQAFS
jgi:glycerol-3-phosphate acyltransferase PlsX